MDHHHKHECSLEELIDLLEIITHRKDLQFMATVQFSASFSVTSGAPPLVVTPPTASLDLVVGTPVDGTVIAVVSGGTAPYSYMVDPASGPLPDGVSVIEDGAGNISLAGTPTTAGVSPSPFLLNITDAAGITAKASFKIK